MSVRRQLSTDKTGDDSLVETTANVYGGLDQTQNHISYPDSKWDNIKNNMGQGGTTPNPGNPGGGNPGTGACAGVAAWNAAVSHQFHQVCHGIEPVSVNSERLRWRPAVHLQ